MTIEERNERMEWVNDKVKRLANSKGKSYASEDDSLANFKRNADRLGLTKYQVWSVYFGKHIDSIFNAIKYNPEKPIDESEGLEGRIYDAITYLHILYCLLNEDKGTE